MAFSKKHANKPMVSSLDSGCFPPDTITSDDESSTNEWEVTGAFPRLTSSSSAATGKNHIFTDEPFDSDFDCLEVVPEGSTCSEDQPQDNSVMVISTTGSETQPLDNRGEVAALRHLGPLGPKFGLPDFLGTSRNGSSESNKYPYSIQGSLVKLDEKQNRDDYKLEEQATHDEPANRGNSNAYGSANTASFLTAASASNIGQASMPSPLTPMTYDEESSGASEEPRNTVERIDNNFSAPHSVISARSRQRSKKYLVRYTLSTSQQVNANPSAMLKNLFIGIEQERHMHKLAAQNLHAVHNWLLFVPCIALSLLSGLLVLIFEAEINVSDDARVYSSIAVGIASLLGVFLQAVSRMLDMGTRGTIHDVTSSAMKRLSEEILLTLSSTDTIPSEYVALISEKLGQALDGCTSAIPYKLESAYSSVSDRMILMLKPPAGQPARKHVHKLDYMRLYSTLYDELNAEIIHFWAWPFMFPRPRAASEAAIRHFKAIITEGREAAIRQPGVIRLCCPCFGENAVERSLFDIVPPASVGDSSHTNTAYHIQSKHAYPIRSSMLGHEV
jgi:hypothetical protein